ncbi:MAG TPA: DUF350 domain-containing protein [Spirochaetota bacterium]|nr:DUF350 domain-containing protein [Spirochaetota bacterium]HOM38032.1 DUF350 domain-containing protein [Spirochaetota bacterium]HPQ48836.1 DUF350 domain-containing protein [Spirochaetota bacterium]
MWGQNLNIMLTRMGEGAIYFLLGLIVMLLGRLIWNLITRYDSNREIGDKDNISAGIAEFGFLIALAIIIWGSIKQDRGDIHLEIDLVISFLYSIFGLICLTIGKFFLDLITPFKLDKEIEEDKNQAAGWLQAGFYIGVAIIVQAVI